MAYTKYSLTPANNNAAPPDGAPEGMLPSAVNDTMRDMMAQIRDVGDGIRGGTYTMTAPVITGGSVSGATGSFTSLTDSGNLTFTGTGNRITGDFSNATVASRVMFQTSTTNGATVVSAIPNGTALISTISAFANSDPTNTSFCGINVNGSTVLANIISGITGTGTYLPLAFQTGGSERLRIDTSGNVGIGTSSPAEKLDVNGGTLVRGAANQTTGNGGLYTSSNGSSTATIEAINPGSAYLALTVSAGTQIFSTNGSERMRIDSSGNLLVGTTSPGANQRNVFKVTTSNQWPLTLDGNNRGLLVVQSDSSGIAAYFTTSTTTVAGEISVSGSSTSYTTSSDYRLKENIAPMTDALAKVTQLKPVTYTWKADGSNGQGFIAHELQAVVPDCVTGEKDATEIQQYEVTPAIPATYDDEGNELTPAVEAVMGEREVPVYQGIDTSFLVATLAAAIQELKATVDAQAARIAALESK